MSDCAARTPLSRAVRLASVPREKRVLRGETRRRGVCASGRRFSLPFDRRAGGGVELRSPHPPAVALCGFSRWARKKRVSQGKTRRRGVCASGCRFSLPFDRRAGGGVELRSPHPSVARCAVQAGMPPPPRETRFAGRNAPSWRAFVRMPFLLLSDRRSDATHDSVAPRGCAPARVAEKRVSRGETRRRGVCASGCRFSLPPRLTPPRPAAPAAPTAPPRPTAPPAPRRTPRAAPRRAPAAPPHPCRAPTANDGAAPPRGCGAVIRAGRVS
ncbi:hypothetical protein QE410_002420 [Microbacterium sp. SORGH_AS 1204]|nr:hypothetical protein [Microbacterium sp. SORGH_AS_1204]